MATNKHSKPLPPEDRPRPGPLPAEDDPVREVGKRALNDVESPKKDTDESGYEGQRVKAPSDAPTKRSGVVDGSED